MIKHKEGKKIEIADTLSRLYTIDDSETKSGKIDHRQGIIVKVPFRLGSIITPDDIIAYLQSSKEQIVIAASDPSISKCCQTETFDETGETKVNQIQENINQVSEVKNNILK